VVMLNFECSMFNGKQKTERKNTSALFDHFNDLRPIERSGLLRRLSVVGGVLYFKPESASQRSVKRKLVKLQFNPIQR
jgi:hypothetical protein